MNRNITNVLHVGRVELYYKMFNKQYGDPSGSEMVASLKLFVIQYNTKCGEKWALMSDDAENLVVYIIMLSFNEKGS